MQRKPCSRAFTKIGKQTTNHAKKVETQHKHMYSLYIGSLPYGTLYLHRDYTGVRENLNAMKHSSELCLL